MKKTLILLNLSLTALSLFLFFEVVSLKEKINSFESEIFTGRLIINNEEGDERIVFNALDGYTTMSFLDSNKDMRMQVATDKNGTFNFFIFDSDGNPRKGWFSSESNSIISYEDNVELMTPDN